MPGGIRETRVASRRRRKGTWLVRRLHRVHHKAVRRNTAVTAPDRRPVERGLWRLWRELEVAGGVELGAHMCRRILERRRAGAGEPEVVEIGAAKGAHEELIGEREFLG